jgi:hypothetical protein
MVVPGIRDGGFELLELDEALKIWGHQEFEMQNAKCKMQKGRSRSSRAVSVCILHLAF